ncbi:MAG: hypothetical protein AAFU57_04600 [Bacteroidota bacterium]
MRLLIFFAFCYLLFYAPLQAQNGIDLSGFTGYATQDFGTGQLSGNNRTLQLLGNAWKKIEVNYTVTPETIVSFQIRVDGPGEIHGIMFDTNNNFNFSLDTPRAFRVFGSQNWANDDFANYPGSGWESYSIPVGQYYTGTFQYFVFIGDKDSNGASQDSTFRNLRIYEGVNEVITNRRITYRVNPDN